MEAIAQIAAEGSYHGHRADFLDGTAFAPDELYLTVGAFSDVAPWRSDYTGQQIYYQSIRRDKEDFLTIRDYLWRWDTDWFWCSRAFGVQNPLIRRLWPRRYRRSDVYRKLVALDRRYRPDRHHDSQRRRPAARGRHPGRGDPGRARRGVPAVLRRQRRHEPGLDVPAAAARRARPGRCTRCSPGEVYVNFGFWGTVAAARRASRTDTTTGWWRTRWRSWTGTSRCTRRLVLPRGGVLPALQRRGLPCRSSAPTTATGGCSACTRSASRARWTVTPATRKERAAWHWPRSSRHSWGRTPR